MTSAPPWRDWGDTMPLELDFGPAAEAFRTEVRAWLEANDGLEKCVLMRESNAAPGR